MIKSKSVIMMFSIISVVVSRGAPVDLFGKSPDTRILTKEVAQKLPDRLGAERSQRPLLVPRFLHPFGAVLWAEVDEQQVLGAPDGVHPLLEPGLCSPHRSSAGPRSG